MRGFYGKGPKGFGGQDFYGPPAMYPNYPRMNRHYDDDDFDPAENVDEAEQYRQERMRRQQEMMKEVAAQLAQSYKNKDWETFELALNQYPHFLYEPQKGKTNLQLFIEDKNLEAVRHAIKAVPNVFSQIPNLDSIVTGILKFKDEKFNQTLFGEKLLSAQYKQNAKVTIDPKQVEKTVRDAIAKCEQLQAQLDKKQKDVQKLLSVAKQSPLPMEEMMGHAIGAMLGMPQRPHLDPEQEKAYAQLQQVISDLKRQINKQQQLVNPDMAMSYLIQNAPKESISSIIVRNYPTVMNYVPKRSKLLNLNMPLLLLSIISKRDDLIKVFVNSPNLSKDYKLPDYTDSNTGNNILHIIAQYNSIQALNYLSGKFPDEIEKLKSTTNTSKQLPYVVAITCNNLDLYKQLLVTPAKSSKKPDTPLHIAARYNVVSLIQEFLDNKEALSAPGRKGTPYQTAALYGSFDAFSLLLPKEEHPENALGPIAEYFSVNLDNHIHMIKLLLESGVPKDQIKGTPSNDPEWVSFIKNF